MSAYFDTTIGARVWPGEMLFAGIDAVAVCVLGLLRETDGLVLAVRRPELPGVLCMPGGKVERGECPRDAARRELLEETGIRLHRGRFQWLGAVEGENVRGPKPIAVAVYLVSTTASPDLRRCEAGLDPCWWPLDDLCDASVHGRFAVPAKLARSRLAALL